MFPPESDSQLQNIGLRDAQAQQIRQHRKGEETSANRKVLQIEKPIHAPELVGQDKSLGPSGSSLQIRYVEQWLNDVLTDAVALEMPGVLKRPEHKNPLSRYEINRIQLTNHGVSLEMVDRIYRSLFTNSVGFFNLLKDCTSTIETGKAAIQSNIWRVFQVLLEYACPNDYKLITQEIEEGHLNKNTDL